MIFIQRKLKILIDAKNRGLTMVETLVAISILTIAVIGPLGIIAQALHTSYYARDQMTAYYLAQEAVEYVRNLRDKQGINITNQYLDNTISTPPPTWIQGVVLLDQLNPRTVTTSLDTYSLTRTAGDYKFDKCLGSCAPLNISTDGIFGDSSAGSVPSNFIREIYFQRVYSDSGFDSGGNPTTPEEFVMVVNVYWKSGSTNSKLTLKEYFTDWVTKTDL